MALTREFDSETGLRSHVEAALGTGLTAAEWELLRECDAVGEALHSDTNLRRPVEFIIERAAGVVCARALRERATPRRTKRRPGGTRRARLSTQLNAESVVRARFADEQLGVRRFRSRYLDDGMINWVDVARWIEDHADSQRSTRWVQVPLPDEMGLAYGDQPRQLRIHPPLVVDQATDMQRRCIVYPDPDTSWTCRRFVRAGTVLDELRSLSESLAKCHGWLPAEATAFVLTGQPPAGQALTTIDTDGRIAIHVDVSASPDEVADLYRSARKALRGPNARFRTHDEQNNDLALIPVDDGTTERERLQAWNEAHPDDKFPPSEVKRFGARRRAARKRLSGRSYLSEVIRGLARGAKNDP